jgi:site-specific DNA recombinase
VPAIVSRELFEAAQAQLDRNKRLAQRNASDARYLLQGLTVCGRCGYAFSGRSADGHAYYYCQGAHCRGEARVCRNPSIAGQPLDEHVWRSVCELLQDPTRMLDEWLRRQQSGGMAAELREQRDEAARALAAQERSLKRLVDAYEIGAIDIKDLKARSESLRARIERARRELADAEQRLRETVALRAIVARVDDFAARVRAGLDALSWIERQQIIRTLVAKIEIDDSGATIVYRLPSTERTPTPPSHPGSGGEGDSGGDPGANCRLRSRRLERLTCSSTCQRAL